MADGGMLLTKDLNRGYPKDSPRQQADFAALLGAEGILKSDMSGQSGD